MRETRIAVVLTFAASCLVAGAEEDSLARIGNVRLKGRLGDTLERMIENHVAATDVDYLVAPFLEKTERNNWWQTEFWGKWMHSAVPYAAYGGSEMLRVKIERSVDRILASQEPSGYIGNYPDEMRCGEGWDVWGMKYTLMGLMHYHDLVERRGGGERRKEEVLNSCKRLCDYVIAEIGPDGKRGRELWQTGNWSGYASSSVLEPVMWLYRRTKEKRYLDFATYIVKGMTEPEKGPRLLDKALEGVSVADRDEPDFRRDASAKWEYVCKHGRSKAYEMMSCYQGLLEYHEVTGRKELLDAVVRTAEDIVREEVNLAGGCASSESWFHGRKKQHKPYVHLQETCVTITWMRLCEKLLDVTGDVKWADQLERTFYNAYLAALKPDGAVFAAYTPLAGSRCRGMNHCFTHNDCCSANGPRGFLGFLDAFCRRADTTVTFNFYGSALVKGFDMYSLYPRQNWVRIVSHTKGPLVVRLRIPAWSARTVVRLNGKECPDVNAGTYFPIDRVWTPGDVIEVSFDMPVVAHVLDHHVAFTRGPVLLARDSRFNDGDLMEPFRNDVGDCRYVGVMDGQQMPMFASVRVPSDDMWMAFSATLPIGSHHENPEGVNPTTVFFCDYASAGNAWRRDNFYRTWFPVELGPTE